MAAVELAKSAEDLRREIEELHRQQREITERLRDPRGLRKGGPPGGNVRNLGSNALHALGHNGPQRGFIRQGEVFNAEDQPPRKRRLLSAVVKVEDEQDTVAEKEKEKEGFDEEEPEKEDADEETDVADRRPTLQRNYNTDDSHPLASEQGTLLAEPLPRILPKTNDPNLAKRNRRMFGALIGTLEKFRQEDQKLSGSEAFMRRSDSLKRAEQKAQEESERLRQQEREQLAEKRKNDLTLRANLAAQADEKQLELLFLQWTEHHTHLCSFLRTTAEPAIYFMPAKPSEETDKLLQESQQGLEGWKVKCQEELNEYRKQKWCDLFTGTWVESPNSEPLYRNESCPIVTKSQNCPGNGRPDSDYLNWRWQPQDCDLPVLDAPAFLKLMRGKTLAFIGDSVGRNQFESLLCMLWQVYPPENQDDKVVHRWVFKKHSFTVMRIWSSWLVNTTEAAIDFAPENLTKLHLEYLDQNIINSLLDIDVMVISSGHWWPRKTAYVLNGTIVGGQGWWDDAHEKEYDALSGYAIAMKTALKAIVSYPNYKGITILRTYSPDHYEKGAWNTGGSCTGKTRPLTTEQLPVNNYTNTMYQHQMVAYEEAERMLGRNPSKLRLMNITRVFEYRADGHPGPYRNNDPNKIVNRGPNGQPPPQDCLHWCMPGPIDTWNYFLFEMLRREFLK
ncbi:unnamed protein product [Sphagnum troendelagicum]|uniref:Trichome birefringence-like N-terminal domain-containing protein n=1 Tax=Sphagnum troendelagicum TaxID=128251 RepID=A0ABP0V123_9BRYO